MLDYLNNESEEVKDVFSRIRETERALQKAMDNYRTLSDGRRSVRIPAYLAQNASNPARHAADTLHRYQRSGVPISRSENTRNPLQELPAYRRPVLNSRMGHAQRNRDTEGERLLCPGSSML